MSDEDSLTEEEVVPCVKCAELQKQVEKLERRKKALKLRLVELENRLVSTETVDGRDGEDDDLVKVPTLEEWRQFKNSQRGREFSKQGHHLSRKRGCGKCPQDLSDCVDKGFKFCREYMIEHGKRPQGKNIVLVEKYMELFIDELQKEVDTDPAELKVSESWYFRLSEVITSNRLYVYATEREAMAHVDDPALQK